MHCYQFTSQRYSLHLKYRINGIYSIVKFQETSEFLYYYLFPEGGKSISRQKHFGEEAASLVLQWRKEITPAILLTAMLSIHFSTKISVVNSCMFL